MRLQKFMAEAGVASRRKCEEYIAAGRVSVNGAVAEIGCCIEPERDEVRFDGRLLKAEARRIVLAFNKPQSVVCTASDPEGRTTVLSYFSHIPERLYNVGRLDYDSEGLLIMTNDGALAHRLTHPRFSLEKTYYVICDGILAPQERRALTEGVLLEDGVTAPARVDAVQRLNNGNTAFLIGIHEGRNRQVRRMLAALGHRTLLLRRVAVGPIRLGTLAVGESRPLSAEELAALDALLD